MKGLLRLGTFLALLFFEGIDPQDVLNTSMVVTTFLPSILQNREVALNIPSFWVPWECYSRKIGGAGVATSGALCV